MATSIDRAGQRRSLRQFASDLSVGRKLVVGFAAITAVLLVLVGGLFATVDHLGAAHEDVAGSATDLAEAADRLRFAAANLRAAQQAYVLDDGVSRPAFADASREFEAALGELRSSVTDPVDRSLVNKVTTGYQTFVVTDQLAWEALDRGEPEVARNLTLGPEGLAFGFMAADAATLTDHAGAQRAEAERKFDQTSHDARLLGLLLAAIALGLVVVASRTITRLIRDPLQRVQQVAELAAEGDLTAQVNVWSDDETGRLARAFNTMLDKLRSREDALLVDHRRQELAGQVHRAFETADDETAALDVVARSMTEIVGDHPSELLLADNSKSHLHQVVVSGRDPNGPGCLVESPFSCPAVRSGTALTYSTSEALDACPHLRGRAQGACSALCVPVTFMGRAMGVLHTIGEEGAPPSEDKAEAMTMLSTQTGARIGMLRSMEKTQTQASTDGLTGLMNRRVFETRARALHRRRVPFTLAMADLDHFKRVNDTYGHDAGDRALRVFAEIATASLRDGDLIARWGGEEFAIAFVDTEPEQAEEILGRLRLELAVRLTDGELRPFTVSYGIVAAHSCPTLDQAVRVADGALYQAKEQGRDRVVIAELAADDLRSPDAPRSPGVLAAIAHDDDPQDY